MFQRSEITAKYTTPRGYPQLRSFYEKLNRAHEWLEFRRERWQDLEKRAAGTVIQEDVLSLLEECEEYLFDWSHASWEEVHSFQVRSLTVLEEVQELLCGRGMSEFR